MLIDPNIRLTARLYMEFMEGARQIKVKVPRPRFRAVWFEKEGQGYLAVLDVKREEATLLLTDGVIADKFVDSILQKHTVSVSEWTPRKRSKS